jgi:hypothetical protein
MKFGFDMVVAQQRATAIFTLPQWNYIQHLMQIIQRPVRCAFQMPLQLNALEEKCRRPDS